MQRKNIKKIFDWLLHLIGYTVVLIIISLLFPKNIYVSSNYYFFWGFIAILIIYVLNKTIKPLLFWLTLPLTALTLGLFYPIINIVILKITDLILGSFFQIKGIFSLFLVSIIISILNAIMDNLIIDKIFKGD